MKSSRYHNSTSGIIMYPATIPWWSPLVVCRIGQSVPRYRCWNVRTWCLLSDRLIRYALIMIDILRDSHRRGNGRPNNTLFVLVLVSSSLADELLCYPHGSWCCVTLLFFGGTASFCSLLQDHHKDWRKLRNSASYLCWKSEEWDMRSGLEQPNRS